MSSVNVHLTRNDVLRFNTAEFARPRIMVRFFIFISVMAFIFVVVKQGLPHNSRGWIVLGVGMLAGSAAGMLAALLFSTLVILFRVSAIPGLLGHHEYDFVEGGLLEKTSANETLIKWNGARALRKSASWLLIEIAPAMAHIIPRKAFGSEAEYNAFADQAKRLVKT